MKKQNKIFSLGSLLTLGAALLIPKLRGSSKKELRQLKMLHKKDPIPVENLRDKLYNEVFLGYRVFNKFKLGIYNNLTRPLPTLDEWNNFDAETIKKENGAAIVMLNGPRYWVLDAIRGYYTGEMRKINGHEFDLVAILEKKIPDLKAEAKNRKKYSETSIGRFTDWIYHKGSRIYELVSDKGIVYTMQAASLEIIKDQNINDLEFLSSKLTLPEGWKFRSRVLEEELIFKIRGEAHVLQDEFRNSYQRNPDQG